MQQVAAVSSFVDAVIAAGFASREQVRALLSAGWLPYVAWRRGDVAGCTTGEAVRNVEVEQREAQLRSRGICPRCQAVTPNYEPGRGLRHKPDCPAWGR